MIAFLPNRQMKYKDKIYYSFIIWKIIQHENVTLLYSITFTVFRPWLAAGFALY